MSTPDSSNGFARFAEYGFEPCDVDEHERCEKCKKVAPLFFGDRDYWDCREGHYYCADCLNERIEDDRKFGEEMSQREELERRCVVIVQTKLAEQAEQFQIGEDHYVGRRVLMDDDDALDRPVDCSLFVSETMRWVDFVLFRLDYDRGDVFVDPSLLRPYKRPERKEEAGT